MSQRVVHANLTKCYWLQTQKERKKSFLIESALNNIFRKPGFFLINWSTKQTQKKRWDHRWIALLILVHTPKHFTFWVEKWKEHFIRLMEHSGRWFSRREFIQHADVVETTMMMPIARKCMWNVSMWRVTYHPSLAEIQKWYMLNKKPQLKFNLHLIFQLSTTWLTTARHPHLTDGEWWVAKKKECD